MRGIAVGLIISALVLPACEKADSAESDGGAAGGTTGGGGSGGSTGGAAGGGGGSGGSTGGGGGSGGSTGGMAAGGGGGAGGHGAGGHGEGGHGEVGACLPEQVVPRMGADVPLEMAAATLAAGWCDAVLACDCGGLLDFADRDACLADFTEEWGEEIATAQGMGLTYVGACVPTIAGLLRGPGCKAREQLERADHLTECTEQACRFFVGAKGVGDACSTLGIGLEECGPGLRCDGTLQACVVADCTPFLPPGARGEVCNSPTGNARRCEAGSACDQDASNCCVPPFAEGERCGTTSVCEAGLVCVAPAPQDFANAVCLPRVAEGEPCFSSDCVDGLVCLIPVGESVGVCGPPRADGDACTTASDCVSKHCLGSVCVPTPGVGEACSGACTEGLACSYSVQPTCLRAGTEGGPCTSPENTCEAGLACDARQLVCRVPSPAGTLCENAVVCETGLFCHPLEGVCAPPMAVICGVRI